MNYKRGKELVSRIHNELSNLNKKTNTLKKDAEDLSRPS